MGTENGRGKSREEAATLCALATAVVVNMYEERITIRFIERMKSLEAEIASLRSTEKIFEIMECHNEG